MLQLLFHATIKLALNQFHRLETGYRAHWIATIVLTVVNMRYQMMIGTVLVVRRFTDFIGIEGCAGMIRCSFAETGDYKLLDIYLVAS